MSRALLLIDADVSPARAALGDLRGSARSAQASVTAEARRASKERERIARDEARAASRAAAEAARERKRLEQASARDAQRAERERTRATEKAAADRLRIEREETRRKDKEARDQTRNAERAERERTRTAEREAQKRTRAAEREARQQLALATRRSRELGGRVASGVGTAARATMSAAVDMHGQFQDARHRRAASEHTLNAAFYQAGINGTEAQAMRARLQREVAEGSLRGMSLQDVAGGLSAAQTQFSVLSQGVTDRMTPAQAAAQRSTNFEQQLQLLQFARDTYQDPAEVLRVGGMLQGQNIVGEDRNTLIRTLTGLGQSGSVELSDVVAQGLQPLMQNISIATSRLGAGASAEQRATAVQNATARAVAVSQVAARGGMGVGYAMSALQKADTALGSSRVADNMHAGLRARGFTEDKINALLTSETDARSGRTVRRFRSNNAVEVFDTLNRLFGGNVTEVENLLRGGGHGTPQIFDSQIRRLGRTLTGQQGTGTIGQAVETIASQGRSFDQEAVERGRNLRNAEDQTAITSAEESRDNQLTDNTSALKNLSDTIANWQIRNPLANSALDATGGVVGALGGSLAAGAIKNTVARAALPSILGGAAGGGGLTGLGATLTGSVGAAGAGSIGAAVAASLGIAGIAGTIANRGIYSDRTSTNARGGNVTEASGQAAYTNVFTGEFWNGFRTSIAQAIEDGMGRATVTAAVPLHEDIHARAAGTRR